MQRLVAAAGLVWLQACSVSGSTDPAAGNFLAVGTWGADGSGFIVRDSTVHIHIACTKGDFPVPKVLDAQGRFVVSGTYVLRAYPVQREDLPAQLSGVVRGSRLTFSIAVDDTVNRKPVALGPITVVFGQEPTMMPCPICRAAADSLGMQRRAPQRLFDRIRGLLNGW